MRQWLVDLLVSTFSKGGSEKEEGRDFRKKSYFVSFS